MRDPKEGNERMRHMRRVELLLFVFLLSSNLPELFAEENPSLAENPGVISSPAVLVSEVQAPSNVPKTSPATIPPTTDFMMGSPLSKSDEASPPAPLVTETNLGFEKLTPKEKEQVQTLLNELETSVQAHEISILELLPPSGATETDYGQKDGSLITLPSPYLGKIIPDGTIGPNSGSDTHFGSKIEVPQPPTALNPFPNDKNMSDMLGMSGSAQPAVNRLAKLHQQLLALAISLVKNGTTDIHTLIQKRYDSAKKQTREENFYSEIQAADSIRANRNTETKQSEIASELKATSGDTNPDTSFDAYSKELAATVAIFTPPKNVHPFLRVVFYRSDPRMVKAYQDVRMEAKGFHEISKWKRDLLRSYTDKHEISSDEMDLNMRSVELRDNILGFFHDKIRNSLAKFFNLR